MLGQNLGRTGSQGFSGLFQAFPSVTPLLITWNPLGPPDGLKVYASIAAGTQVNHTDLFPTLITLTLAEDTFLPISGQNGMQLQPSTGTTAAGPVSFLAGRLSAGTLELHSEQTSTTAASLSGTVAGGVICDLSKITNKNYSQQNINQFTAMNKEKLMGQNIVAGIKCVLATDIRSNYLYPFATACSEPVTTVLSALGNASWPFSPYVAPPAVATGTDLAPAFVLFNEYLAYTGGSSITTVALPDLPPTSPVTFSLPLQTTIAGVTNLYATVQVQMIHYYGTCTDPTTNTVTPIAPTVSFLSITDVLNAPVAGNTTIGTRSSAPTGRVTCTAPYVNGYLYLGSMLCLNPTNFAQWAAATGVTVALLQPSVTFAANDVTSGPWRVLRTDNLANNQQLVIRFEGTAEWAPTRSLAPYLTVPHEQDVTEEKIEEEREKVDDPASDVRRVAPAY
jgi:hypothetical protein